LRHAITYNQATMSEFEFAEVVRLMERLSTELQRLEVRVDTGFKELRGEIAQLRYSFDRQDARLERHGALQTGSRRVNRMNPCPRRATACWLAGTTATSVSRNASESSNQTDTKNRVHRRKRLPAEQHSRNQKGQPASGRWTG
jgi:hypothetical protein